MNAVSGIIAPMFVFVHWGLWENHNKISKQMRCKHEMLCRIWKKRGINMAKKYIMVESWQTFDLIPFFFFHSRAIIILIFRPSFLQFHHVWRWSKIFSGLLMQGQRQQRERGSHWPSHHQPNPNIYLTNRRLSSMSLVSKMLMKKGMKGVSNSSVSERA